MIVIAFEFNVDVILQLYWSEVQIISGIKLVYSVTKFILLLKGLFKNELYLKLQNTFVYTRKPDSRIKARIKSELRGKSTENSE